MTRVDQAVVSAFAALYGYAEHFTGRSFCLVPSEAIALPITHLDRPSGFLGLDCDRSGAVRAAVRVQVRDQANGEAGRAMDLRNAAAVRSRELHEDADSWLRFAWGLLYVLDPAASGAGALPLSVEEHGSECGGVRRPVEGWPTGEGQAAADLWLTLALGVLAPHSAEQWARAIGEARGHPPPVVEVQATAVGEVVRYLQKVEPEIGRVELLCNEADAHFRALLVGDKPRQSAARGLGPGRKGTAAPLRPYLRAVLDRGGWEKPPGMSPTAALAKAWEAECLEDPAGARYLAELHEDKRPSMLSPRQVRAHREEARNLSAASAEG